VICLLSPQGRVGLKLEKGKIGHRAAMQWLNVKSYDALMEIMYVNGKLMPGHQPMRVDPETSALVRRIFRPAAPPKLPSGYARVSTVDRNLALLRDAPTERNVFASSMGAAESPRITRRLLQGA
jgi:hypothetical protein